MLDIAVVERGHSVRAHRTKPAAACRELSRAVLPVLSRRIADELLCGCHDASGDLDRHRRQRSGTTRHSWPGPAYLRVPRSRWLHGSALDGPDILSVLGQHLLRSLQPDERAHARGHVLHVACKAALRDLEATLDLEDGIASLGIGWQYLRRLR